MPQKTLFKYSKFCKDEKQKHVKLNNLLQN